jgi:hypothetical protein
MKTEYWILLLLAGAAGYYLYTQQTATTPAPTAIGNAVILNSAYGSYAAGTVFTLTGTSGTNSTVQDQNGATSTIPTSMLAATNQLPGIPSQYTNQAHGFRRFG